MICPTPNPLPGGEGKKVAALRAAAASEASPLKAPLLANKAFFLMLAHRRAPFNKHKPPESRRLVQIPYHSVSRKRIHLPCSQVT